MTDSAVSRTYHPDPVLKEVFDVLHNAHNKENFASLCNMTFHEFHEYRKHLAVIGSYKEELQWNQLSASGQL